jgi:hypothetical protein
MLIEVELLMVDILLFLVPTTSNNIFLLCVLMVLSLQDKFVLVSSCMNLMLSCN